MGTVWEQATSVERTDADVYTASLDETWWAHNGPHGGYLAAVVLRAMGARVEDPGRPARSYTIHFLSRADPGPVEIETTIVRAGRSMSTIAATARQGERTIATALGAFSAPREEIAGIEDAVVPDVTPVDDARVLPREGPGFPAFLRHLDARLAMGAKPFSGAGEAVLGSWIRMVEPQPLDAPLTALYADAVAPAIWPRVSEPVMTITIDLTIHFRHALPSPDVRDDAFTLAVFRTRVARDGFAEEDGEIWDDRGRLVAQTRQLEIVRAFTP